MPGEAPLAFVTRVARINGFGSTRQLLVRLERERDATPFEALSRLLKLADEERKQLFGVLPKRWGGPPAPLGLAASDFNQTAKRWCPQCLAESGMHDGRWTLKLVCVCTAHASRLRTTCARCGQAQRWQGLDLTSCACGASLTLGPTEVAAAGLVELTRSLTDGSSPLRLVRGGQSLSPAAWHRLVRLLGRFTPGFKPRRPGQISHLHQLDVASPLVDGATKLLSDWPRQFETLLHALRGPVPTTLSIEKAFAPLYQVLYGDLSGAEFQFLRDAFEGYLRQHWWGMVSGRHRRMRPVEHGGRRLTVPQAASAAAVPESVMRHMIQADLLPAVAVRSTAGRAFITLDEADAKRAATAAQHACTLQEASLVLGLPEVRVRQFIDAGLIVPIVSRRTTSAARWLIATSELQRWRAPSAHDGVAVRHVLRYWHLTAEEQTALVRALLAGELQPAADTGGREPIGFVRLDPALIRRWLTKQRSGSPSMTIDCAAKRLGVKQQVGYDLVRRGLLQASPSSSGDVVCPESLQRFTASFISLAELARRFATSPKAMLHRLDAVPVTGPAIDGCRQYFYRRMDLEPALIPSAHFEE
jgi:hypothetical protein